MSKLYGVIGHPIAHSLSPIMHNSAFQALNIDAYYHAFDIKPENLQDAIKGFRAIGIDGFNVTIPHKVSIMEYLDEIDDLAVAIGAVNTVKNVDGKLVGYNTDGPGYIRGLLTIVQALKDKRVLIIGAGGAARGIAIPISNKGLKSLTITNRTTVKAKIILEKCNQGIMLSTLELREAEEKLDQFDIIINTTSVGLYPNVSETPLNLSKIREGTIVSDIIYNPFFTEWLKLAKQKGETIQNGIPMFINQGALAFEIWTGQTPDVKLMENTVIKQLGGNEYVNR